MNNVSKVENPKKASLKETIHKIKNIAVTVLILLPFLKGSINPIPVDGGEYNPLSNAQLMRPDSTQHENECVTDADCNPGIAHPDRFTSSCGGRPDGANGSAITGGGNQGQTCYP